MRFMKLKEPWWGAWSKFGWEKGTPGFGLKADEVESALGDIIEVQTRGEAYRLDALTIVEECTKHNWTYTARNNTRLYVMPQSAFTQVYKNQLDESFTCCSLVNVPAGTTMRCPVCMEMCVTEAE